MFEGQNGIWHIAWKLRVIIVNFPSSTLFSSSPSRRLPPAQCWQLSSVFHSCRRSLPSSDFAFNFFSLCFCFQDFLSFYLRLHSLRNFDMGGLPFVNSSSAIALPESKLDQGSAVVKSTPDGKPKKKICCACPDTKKLRDECIVEHGEEACGKWIEAHRKCLRAEGFNV